MRQGRNKGGDFPGFIACILRAVILCATLLPAAAGFAACPGQGPGRRRIGKDRCQDQRGRQKRLVLRGLRYSAEMDALDKAVEEAWKDTLRLLRSLRHCLRVSIERGGFMAEMTAQEAAEWGKTLDFPTVWATITKLGEKIDLVSSNTAAVIDKMGKRVDKAANTVDKLGERIDRVTANTAIAIDKLGERIDKRAEQVDRVTANTAVTIDKLGEKVDRVTANVGGLNVSMGELIETLFGPHIGEKFDVYQYNLKRIFKRVPIYDDTSRQRGEIDLLLSNTTICMALEVKRWLDNKTQIDEHVQRMKLIRQYPPAETKGKKLLGAMAGAVVTSEAREYAEESGFFVLELTGDDVCLLEPPEYFQPKEW